MGAVNPIEIGTQFYFLTVTKKIGGDRSLYECLCKCGKTCIKGSTELRKGSIKSCGCWRKAVGHNLTNSPTYRSWRAIKDRCDKVTHHNYHRYGGRGISYDPRWTEFKAFLDDMGLRPAGKTIDRIDNNADYSKSNCRWATSKEQQNNKSDNVVIEHNGARLTVMQLSELTGISWDTVRDRVRRGWTADRIITNVALKTA